jgi:hypothetical protein
MRARVIPVGALWACLACNGGAGDGAETTDADGGGDQDASTSGASDGTGTDTGTGGDGDGDGDGDGAVSCDDASGYPAVPEGLQLQSEFSDASTHEVLTDGIWAIWWDPAFDHAADAMQMFAHLNDLRCRAIVELGMADPPNPGRGVFYNVYIHHGAADSFPAGWANGQGTDTFSNPFLTLPEGAHLDPGNLDHEGFHVFQYSADSPGFAYAGDTQWYVESSAQWYAAYRNPTGQNTFIEAGAIDGNPQLALWHSFSNEAPGDPTDWLYQVRQYGMHTWLYYLTDVAGADADVITAGFFGGVQESPQRYHADRVGLDVLRGYFSDWAAHNTADFDYLTPEQVARARAEVVAVADAANLHPTVAVHDASGSGGWMRPPAEFEPRGWAYNVVQIDNTADGSLTFEIRGDASGSEGAASHFEARVLTIGSTGPQYTVVPMSSELEGSVSVTVSATDTELDLVVVSVPEHYGGYQTYGYEYRVTP